MIPEEFETSVEIFTRVLHRYLVPRNVIDRCVREVRKGAYEMLRDLEVGGRPAEGIERFLSDIAMEVFHIEPGSPLAGKALHESQLRTRSGATLVALQKAGGALVGNPAPQTVAEQGDLAAVLGTAEQLAAAAPLFAAPGEDLGTGAANG